MCVLFVVGGKYFSDETQIIVSETGLNRMWCLTLFSVFRVIVRDQERFTSLIDKSRIFFKKVTTYIVDDGAEWVIWFG